MRIAFVVALSVVATPAFAAVPNAATVTAIHWLALIDRGYDARSWSEAGAQFKVHLTSSGWAALVTAARRPLGVVLSRKLEGLQEVHSIPAASDGDYAIVKFDTRFTKKSTSVETVVLEQELSVWKVDGYFIR